MTMAHRELRLSGRVQGVGFRPFLARLASKHQLVGWVQNENGRVRVRIQGTLDRLDAYQTDVLRLAPPAARPVMDSMTNLELATYQYFEIQPSTRPEEATAFPQLPLDLYTCPDCLSELKDPNNRRYGYPFINCTQCGPRYSLLADLPYDRPMTSMVGFEMCAACRAEYENPLDRRYHAEPIACPDCGPTLMWRSGEQTLSGASGLTRCIDALAAGNIVAVKGVGGFHLMCNALNDAAIGRIRDIKQRAEKPLAVLFHPDTNHAAGLHRFVEYSPEGLSLLTSVERPIVLCSQKAGSLLSPLINPRLSEVGAMLPYSPLHALMMDRLTFPLVVTSANRKSEPVYGTLAQVQRLPVDGILDHNRAILFPVDDSVWFDSGLPVRLGRGHTPQVFDMPFTSGKTIAALGAEDKVTFAFARNNQLIVSPHIGSLTTPAGQQLASKLVDHYSKLFQCNVEQWLGDAHPQYHQRLWLEKSNRSLTQAVPHHKAHASAVWFDAWLQQKIVNTDEMLVFTWDGTGLGDDGTLWGGEAFIGTPGNWTRVASLEPFRLPGGDVCVTEPWRTALSMIGYTAFTNVDASAMSMVQHQLARNVNCVQSSSMGRLLDACAAILGVETSSYDAFAAMQLNTLAEGHQGVLVPLVWPLDQQGLHRLDWRPLLQYLIESDDELGEKAATVFRSLANAMMTLLLELHDTQRLAVGCTGGVMQSQRLREQLQATTLKMNRRFLYHECFPANDAAISVGQIIERLGAHHV